VLVFAAGEREASCCVVARSGDDEVEPLGGAVGRGGGLGEFVVREGD